MTIPKAQNQDKSTEGHAQASACARAQLWCRRPRLQAQSQASSAIIGKADAHLESGVKM
jgi:hypothetical protein